MSGPNCPTCGGWHPEDVLAQTDGICPGDMSAPTLDDLRVVQLITDYANEQKDITDLSSAIEDVLTDLYHYCDTNHLDFEELRKAAYEEYLKEKD